MTKRKAGLPTNFDIGITKPSEKPIRVGDYLDEIDSLPAGASVATTPAKPEVEPKRVPGLSVPSTAQDSRETEHKNQSPKVQQKAKGDSPSRTRLNVSLDGQRRLDEIWQRMREYGPEKTLRKSEIIEALILAAYEARDHLDLSNVRRRGKYGSATHKNFPIALAESVRIAITENKNG